MAEDPSIKNDPTPEDPWQKLTPAEKKRAERHLILLYVAMILMVISPFIVFFFFKK